MLLPRFRLQVPLSLISLLSIGLLLGLAACGENSSTPTFTSTTAPASATTAAFATTGSISAIGSKLNLPGVTAVTLDPALEKVLKDYLSLNNSNIPDLSLTIYTSNDEPPTLGENADKSLSGAGYTFHDVRGSKDTVLTIRNADGAGAYTKSGVPDIILEARESSALTNIKDVPPGISPDVYQKMIGQIKGKKSVLIVLAGTNLFQTVEDARNNSPVGSNGAATATPGPTK